MAHLIHISEAASMALHAMVLLAQNPGNTQNNRALAKVTGGSEAHLAKVMQRLTRANLVLGTRGPKGGFCLVRSAETITLLDVFEAVEGPLEPVECLLGDPICGGRCILGGLLDKVETDAKKYLAEKSLADFPGIFFGGCHDKT